MDRSIRNLSITTLLVLATFLALNHIMMRSVLADWGAVLFFLLLAVAIWFYDRVSRRSIDDSEIVDDTLIEPLTYEHPVGSIKIPDSVQVAGPDLTRSPVQEAPPIIQNPPEATPVPSEPRSTADQSPTSSSDDSEPEKTEAPAATPNSDEHPPAAAPETTTIEEKSAQPTSAPAPETHPDLADKSPERAWSPSVPPDENSANEPVPTPVGGTAPEPVAPRTDTEPVPDISPKESSAGSPSTPSATADSEVNAASSAAPITSAATPVMDDVKVSASEAAEAAPASPDPNLPINAVTDKADDLKIIEGIGPKMEKALQAAGISTFAMLAGASETQIREAIVAAGMRFAPTVPTWAEQASYAANGDFVGLEAYQKTLVGGRKSK